MLKPVLFVTGVMRSGTTLLHRVLAQSCRSEFIRELDAPRVMTESFQVLDDHKAFVPLGRDGYVRLYAQLLTATFNACAARMYGGTIVLKDPLALKALEALHELAPGVKFVLSVRDPLATVTSIYRVRNRQHKLGQTSFISAMGFGDVVEYVARLSDVILALRDQGNVMIVRYEDLVAREPGLVVELGRFAGAEIDLELDDTSSEYDPEHAFWTPESGRPIETSSLRKHHDELDREQSDLVGSRLARFRDAFGYVSAAPASRVGEHAS